MHGHVPLLPLSRRQLLRAATGAAVGAILVACGGKTPTSTPAPSPTSPTSPAGGLTTAPSAPSSTASAVAITAAPAATAAPTTAAASVAAGSAPSGSGTAATQPAGAGGALLRMLAFVPDRPDLLQQDFLTFSNLAAVRKLFGYETIRSTADLQARNIPAIDYNNAISGCPLSAFTGQQHTLTGAYRDAFGYDAFQVDQEISTGQPPNYFAHMEGAFDAAAVQAKLKEGGYTATDRNGVPFFTVREDLQISVGDPRSSLALARMNRVAVSTTRIIAGPSTPIINATIDAEAKKTRTLDANPTWHALAAALGDVTAMSSTPPTLLDSFNFLDNRGRLAEMTKNWGRLHLPELTAMGYTDAGKTQRTMHVALVYRSLADATADAPELVKRIMGYQSVRTQQPFIPTYVTGVTSRVLTDGGRGVLIVDMPFAPDRLPNFWTQSLYSRDTLFLVPDVSVLRGTAAPGTAPSGSATTASGSATARPTTRP